MHGTTIIHGPFRTASLAAQAWIATHRPGAHRPNMPRTTGVLGRFRLPPRAQAEAGDLLAGHLPGLTEPPGSLAGLFCLLAVQALRARAPGKPWAWATVAEALPPRLRDMKHATMRELTESGLRFWSRPVRFGADGDHRYLHSLVLEAGIPDALLGRPDTSISCVACNAIWTVTGRRRSSRRRRWPRRTGIVCLSPGASPRRWRSRRNCFWL